jgi:hypothetical protein
MSGASRYEGRKFSDANHPSHGTPVFTDSD